MKRREKSRDPTAILKIFSSAVGSKSAPQVGFWIINVSERKHSIRLTFFFFFSKILFIKGEVIICTQTYRKKKKGS